MTRFLRYLPCAALTMLLAACGDDSDYFYTTSYPVVRLDATVTLNAVTPPDTDGETDGETPENPLIQQIKDDVIADAPVQPGGSYRLEFEYFDSGRLTVLPSPGGEALRGGFLKLPGATQISFFYGDNAFTYVMQNYTTEESIRATLLTVDLTEQYQSLYPDAEITRVTRLEYTSHSE